MVQSSEGSREGFSTRREQPVQVEQLPSIKSSEDPLVSFPKETLAEIEMEGMLEVEHEKLFARLAAIGIDIQKIRTVLIFGPGMVETQAICHALEKQGILPGALSVIVVDGDPRVIGYIESKKLPESVTTYSQTFAEFLVSPSPTLSVDVVYITNTGPVTCDPNIGFSPHNTAGIGDLVKQGGLIVTRGEVHELPMYLDDTPTLRHILDLPSSFSHGFHCWKKNEE